MSVKQFPKSPNRVHPTLPSAVGSRNSLAQEGRDKVDEAKLIIDDIAEKIMGLEGRKPHKSQKNAGVSGEDD
jgi:hypothetical protein